MAMDCLPGKHMVFKATLRHPRVHPRLTVELCSLGRRRPHGGGSEELGVTVAHGKQKRRKSIWGQELCLNFVLFSSKRKYYFTL